MKYSAWNILFISLLLSLCTIHFFGGCFDDTATIILATGRGPLSGWLHWHEWGMNAFWNLLAPHFGHSLDLYRLPILLCGLLAYFLLAWSVRGSPLAVMGLATLLWMPETYCTFRMLRYDAVTLLVISIQVLWIQKRGILLSILSGIFAGACPMVTLQGILVLPAVLIFLVLSWRQFSYPDLLLWGIWAFCGGMLFIHFYPWDMWSWEFTAYTNLYGMCAARPMGILMLNHPIWCLDRILAVSDFDLMWNHYAAVPFFWVFFGVVAWTQSRPLSRFALCFSLSHMLFSMSYYPNLLFPLFVMAAGEAVDGPKRN